MDEHICKRAADVLWLTQVLFCLEPAHEVFQKAYKYRRPQDALSMNTVPILSNDDGFFDGLPLLLPGEQKKRRVRLSKKMMNQLKVQALQERKQRIESRLEQATKALEADSDDQGDDAHQQEQAQVSQEQQ